MKWLQSLVEIKIDPIRCPLAASEFIDYEHEIDKDGNYISNYPDKHNHAIDFARYATNMTRRRWIDELLRVGVLDSHGWLILPTFFVDRLKNVLRENYDKQTDKKKNELDAEADRIIDVIDRED